MLATSVSFVLTRSFKIQMTHNTRTHFSKSYWLHGFTSWEISPFFHFESSDPVNQFAHVTTTHLARHVQDCVDLIIAFDVGATFLWGLDFDHAIYLRNGSQVSVARKEDSFLLYDMRYIMKRPGYMGLSAHFQWKIVCGIVSALSMENCRQGCIS